MIEKVLEVELLNYRCFMHPISAKLRLRKGQTVALLGKNNVGKSTLMKFFYELKTILVDFHSGGWGNADSNWRAVGAFNLSGGQRYGLADVLELFPNHDFSQTLKFSVKYSETKCTFSVERRNNVYELTKVLELPSGHQPGPDPEWQEILSNTLYVGAHRNLVNQSAGGSGYFDLSVGSAFIAEWDQLKNGDNTEHGSLALLAENLIADLLDWDSVSLNKSSASAQLYLTYRNRRYSIAELGAGVSELVLSIVAAAVKRPSWIFIDEPESHLHPALQVKFISALERLASQGIVFSTHSIGLARTCADEVFVVQQDKHGNSGLRPFEATINFCELMGELSFAQFRDLGFNKLLLCEGVTEVKTLRQFLRLWGLDASVMLIPLGGSALIDPKRRDEVFEFTRFGVGVFVLVDSEKDAENHENSQRTKFVEMCEGIFGKGHAIQTAKRATENYFTARAVNEAMRSEKYRSLEPFESSDEYPMFWGKNQNWRVAAEMRKQEFEGSDLGDFFQKILEHA